MKLSIKEMYVCLLTTGKILEENLNFTSTQRTNVPTGGLGHLSAATEMAVQMNTSAAAVTAGRNKSITLRTIS